MFTVTPAALAEVARRLEGKEEPVGIRIFVQGIGWGGPSLGMALEGPYEDDVAVVEGGARIYFSQQVVRSFAGAELSWEEDDWGGGFTVKHPALGSC